MKQPALKAAIISVDKTGHINQCRALCEGMDWCIQSINRISGASRSDSFVKKLKIALRSRAQVRKAIAAVRQERPDILVFSGNASHRAAANIATHPARKIFVGNPKGPRPVFDIAIASRHGVPAGTSESATFYPSARHTIWMDGVLCSPIANSASTAVTALIIGGHNKAFAIDSGRIAAQIESLLMQGQALAIAFSRRTPDAIEQSLRHQFAMPQVSFVARNDRQAFLKLLANAGHFCLTPDSITMICEACSTGRPVSIFELDVMNSNSSTFRFVETFLQKKYIRLNTSIKLHQQNQWTDVPGVYDQMSQLMGTQRADVIGQMS